MKARENTGAEQCLTFVDGHSIMFGPNEVSRELTEEEISDPYFAKAKQARRVVEYREPQPPAVIKEEKPKPEPEKEPEPELELEPAKEPEGEPGGEPVEAEKKEEKPRESFARKKSTKKSS